MRAHRVLGFLALRCFAAGASGAAVCDLDHRRRRAPATPVAALKASIGDPTRLAGDAAGNVYFASLHSVFKVDTAGL